MFYLFSQAKEEDLLKCLYYFPRQKEEKVLKCHHFFPRKVSKMSSLFSQAKEEKVHGRNRLPESAGALPRGCGKASASQVRG